MTSRPTVSPLLVAEITDSAPRRVRKKIDRDPDAAKQWEWLQRDDDWVVEIGDQTVRLRTSNNHVAALGDVSCSCLLSPRCYHLLACLTLLEPAEPAVSGDETNIRHSPADPAGDETESAEAGQEQQPNESSPDVHAAADLIWQAAAQLLEAGARSGGSRLQSRLLRAVHECRCVGLHRLANLGIRVTTETRKMVAQHQAFDSDALTDDLGELLSVAWQLRSQSQPKSPLFGVARRSYSPVGSLRLSGLFCEPILTSSGYAGVVSYFADDEGQIFTVSNVRQGGPERITAAWRTGIDIGGLSLSHRVASQHVILLQKATRSVDDRLGSGSECRAVAGETSSWADDGVRSRFEEPLEDQIRRIFHDLNGEDPAFRAAGRDLVFAQGTIQGTDGECVLLQLTDSSHCLRLAIAHDDPDLPFCENLRLLAATSKLPLRCVGRLLVSRPGAVAALAVAPDAAASETDPENDWRLPRDWNSRVSLGLDRLQGAYLLRSADEPILVRAAGRSKSSDGLHHFRQRLRSLALGGRHSLPTAGMKAMQRESQQLADQLQPTAASLLQGLIAAASQWKHDIQGTRTAGDPQSLATQWLAAHLYQQSVREQFQQQEWLQETTNE